MKSIFIISSMILFLSGCYYDNQEELHPSSGPCDTSGTISYNSDIQLIISTSCGSQDPSCHNSSATQSGYPFDTYENLVLSIDLSGKFLQTITHDPAIASSKWMPKGVSAKIDDCSIQKIRAWLNRGKPKT